MSVQEHHIAVRRTARYYTLGDPGAAELWFVIHGYGQLARRFLRRFEGIATGQRRIVAPEALNRYYSEQTPGFHTADARIGATWMTREDRAAEIDDYVAYLDQLYDTLLAASPVPPRRLVLLGFSQGTATACRWAALGTARFSELFLWAGYLPPELEPRPQLFAGARTTLVYGRHDGYTPPAKVKAQSEALEAGELEHDVVWYDGGHEIEPEPLRSLAARSG